MSPGTAPGSWLQLCEHRWGVTTPTAACGSRGAPAALVPLGPVSGIGSFHGSGASQERATVRVLGLILCSCWCRSRSQRLCWAELQSRGSSIGPSGAGTRHCLCAWPCHRTGGSGAQFGGERFQAPSALIQPSPAAAVAGRA